MSRQRLGARNKVVQKISKDGLVERDMTAGVEKRVSMRNVEYTLREKPTEKGYSQRGDTPVANKRNKQIVQRAHEPQQQANNTASQPETPRRESNAENIDERPQNAEQRQSAQEADSTADQSAELEQSATTSPIHPNPPKQSSPLIQPVVRQKPPRMYRSESTFKQQDSGTFRQDKPTALRQESPPPADFSQPRGDTSPASPTPRRDAVNAGRKFFRQENAPAIEASPPQVSPTFVREKPSALRQDSPRTNPTRQQDVTSARGATPQHNANHTAKQFRQPEAKPSPTDSPTNPPARTNTAPAPKPPAAERSNTLQFTQNEAAPPTPKGRGVETAERRLERTAGKLGKARENLPSKRKFRVETVHDEKSGKAGRKLTFEKEVKSQRAHLKGSLPLRPVKAGANTAVAFGHRKLYQVQDENVGTEAAHKGELLAEGGLRTASRHSKTSPYRKVSKLERKTTKKSAKLSFEKGKAGNPAPSRKAARKAMQRKRVRSGYAKAARAAGNLAKRAGSAAAKAIKSAAALVTKHPAVMIGIVVAILIVFIGMSLVGLFANAGTSALSGAITASYLAENADIENAELTYTVWETELREQLENIKADYPGYDEYVLDFDVDEIVHDPLALLAYLTALYQDYTLSEIETELRELFDEQYALEIEATVETRYHDPDDSDNDGDYEPYDWHILTVTLTVTDLAELIDASLTDDQREHYETLMETGGGRQYAGSPFAFDWKPYITCLYGWRPDPFTEESDYHTGIDIGVPVGTPIIAAHSGVVTQAVWGASGYGRYITIEGENGLSTRYAHCDTLLVAVGQEVKQGAVIATSGNTGNSTGPHLHYEVMLDGQHVNPIFFANTTTEETA